MVPATRKLIFLKKKKKTSDTYTWFKDIPRIVRFSMKTEGGLVHYAFPSYFCNKLNGKEPENEYSFDRSFFFFNF